MRARALILALAALLSACSGADMVPARNKAARLAADAGWRYELRDSGGFVLATAQSPVPASDILTIYLEGDGMAFLGAGRVSPDPTPENPIGLRLALQHGAEAAAYVARPCQYSLPNGKGRNCDPAVWTGRRYASEVVESMDAAVDGLKKRSGARRLVLVGYSGGGVLAALLAVRRGDVAGIVTVAANLDVKYWVARDHLSPLVGSLDPADFPDRLRTIPQVHLVGGRDEVVTSDVVASYVNKLGAGAPVSVVEMAGYSHVCCWTENWSNLMRRSEVARVMHPQQ